MEETGRESQAEFSRRRQEAKVRPLGSIGLFTEGAYSMRPNDGVELVSEAQQARRDELREAGTTIPTTEAGMFLQRLVEDREQGRGYSSPRTIGHSAVSRQLE